MQQWCDDPWGEAHFLGKVIRVSGIITQTYPFCICLSEISEIICRGSVLASREVIWGIISQLLKYRAGVTIVRLRSPLSQSAFDSIISPSATLVKSFTIRALARPKCVPKYSVCMCACVGRGGEYTRLCHKCYQKLGQTEEVFTLIIVPCSHRPRLFLWVTRSELRGGAFRHIDETPCLSETMRRSSHTETVMLRSETREACLKA